MKRYQKINHIKEDSFFENNHYTTLMNEYKSLKGLIDALSPSLDNIRQKLSPIKSELNLTTNAMNMLNKLATNLAQNIGQKLGNIMVDQGGNVFGNSNKFGFLEKLLNNFVHEGRAIGGNIGGGKSYLVGEKGPEVFTPHSSGMITPNNYASSKRQAININLNLNSNTKNNFGKSNSQQLRELSKAISKLN